jgi:hypothetical protein
MRKKQVILRSLAIGLLPDGALGLTKDLSLCL